jgi:hypothetical protein
MVLVQTAFCLGLARRAIEEARPRLQGVAASLTPRVDEVAGAVAAARELLQGFAARPARAAPREHAALRQDAARLAGEATHLVAAVAGGAGYVADSPTARRLREAAFLPVQARPRPSWRCCAGEQKSVLEHALLLTCAERTSTTAAGPARRGGRARAADRG